MFETLIENTRVRILNSIVSKNKYIYLQDILQNDMINSCFRSYYTAEVSWWIYKEQLLRKKNSSFDLNEENIKSFYEKIDELYMKTARFDMSHIEKVTDIAVKTILNFLVRPQTTLKWFVYRGELTKNFYETILRLDYFYYYSYLTDSIISNFGSDKEFLEQKVFITAPEFSDAIDKIDTEYVSNLDTDGFIELITPIFRFFNYGKEVNFDSKIPIEAMVLYFDDKSLVLLKKKTESMLYDKDIKLVSMNDIKSILENISLSESDEAIDDNDVTIGNDDGEEDLLIPEFNLPLSEQDAVHEPDKIIENTDDIDPNENIETDDFEEAEDIVASDEEVEDLSDISEEDLIEKFEVAELDEYIDDGINDDQKNISPEKYPIDEVNDDNDELIKEENEEDFHDEDIKPELNDDISSLDNETDFYNETTDQDSNPQENEQDQEGISNDYINNVFNSVFDSFGAEGVDLSSIPNTDKKRLSDILSKSLSIIEDSFKDYDTDNKNNNSETEDSISDQNDSELEIDDIELMKQSLGLDDKEEDAPNLAETIAKKFVEESTKLPKDDNIISDDDTEELKDFINEDFEDDGK